MIALDTSSLIAFFSEKSGGDIEKVDKALFEKQALLPPVVLTELLSIPKISENLIETLKQIPLVELRPGYWERSGATRAKILAKGLKARVADALIAQCCIDENIPLITRDADFRHFASLCGLRLV
jgi:predicted nucleic acid-binding protein